MKPHPSCLTPFEGVRAPRAQTGSLTQDDAGRSPRAALKHRPYKIHTGNRGFHPGAAGSPRIPPGGGERMGSS